MNLELRGFSMIKSDATNLTRSAQDADENPNLGSSSGKLVWEEPKLSRMDISLTQGNFGGSPDSDTTS